MTRLELRPPIDRQYEIYETSRTRHRIGFSGLDAGRRREVFAPVSWPGDNIPALPGARIQLRARIGRGAGEWRTPDLEGRFRMESDR
jgi:hypothetical protein